MNNAIDITAAQRDIILALLGKHLPNTAAWVYGSRATWNAHPQSDLDMVVFATPAQERGVSDLRDAFEESALPFRVDLFVWDAVPESFHKQIEAEHVVLVEKEEEVSRNPLHVPIGIGTVPVKWRWSRLEDVCDGIFDCPHSTPNLSDSGPLMVQTQDILSGVFRTDQAGHVSEETYRERTKRAEPTHGDLFYSCEGTYFGIAAEVPRNYRVCLGQRMVLLRPNPQAVDFRYLRFWLNGPAMEAHIHGFRDGSVAERLNLPTIRLLPVLLPPLPEQRAIAHILGTLDDKIELNRRMNETLEEMARVLFKSWFVDFDPVHAKATLKHHAANQAPRQAVSTPATEAARSEITPPLRGSRQAKGASPQARRRGEIRRLYFPQTLQKAQALRHNQTDAEGLLWHYLRNKQLDGHKFRRQQPIGPYIADFACLSQKLLIELDGSQHATRQDYDEKRDALLREKGYRVLRFWNNEVFENCFGVLESIYAVLPHHPPLGGGSKDASFSGRGDPPPQQPAPDGLAAATPPQGGSDWTVERARAYLDGMDADIAALFPDRFVDSELREIPAGWEETTLDKIALLNSETWTARNAPETLVYVDLSNTKWGTIEKCETYEWKDAPSRAKRVLRIGDTILGTVRPGNGSYAFISEEGLTGSTGFAVLRPSLTRDRAIVWCCATASENIERLTHLADGAAYPAVRPQVVGATKIVLPSERVRNIFATICDPLLGQMEANKREARILAALRDTLLSKLISGKLRVKDMEKTSEELMRSENR